jgi:hypothetical protein
VRCGDSVADAVGMLLAPRGAAGPGGLAGLSGYVGIR